MICLAGVDIPPCISSFRYPRAGVILVRAIRLGLFTYWRCCRLTHLTDVIKKLRYHEEHSASVVLSWCTL